MESPNRIGNMMTTMMDVIGVGPSRPRSLAPQPQWQTGTMTAEAAPMHSRFITAALAGTAMERNTSISSRNDTKMTAPMNNGSFWESWAFRSSVTAVMPEMYTLPGMTSRTLSMVVEVFG